MSLLEKLRNKPKAKQKERIRVGFRGAPKEKVQIKGKHMDHVVKTIKKYEYKNTPLLHIYI